MPSTVISFIHYDASEQVLRVGYVSGMIYDYKKVPEHVYLDMKAAFSKGTYLNRHIKNKYEFEKVDNMESLTVNENIMAAIHYIKGSININTNADKVWLLLTDPSKIKMYAGVSMKSDWKKGSEITWETEQAETNYQHKGKVLEHEHEKILKYSEPGSASGLETSGKEFATITWTLENTMDGLTTLMYTKENIPTLEERAMLEEQLPSMLDEIKRLAEEDPV